MVILNNAGHLYLDYENPQPNPELHKGLKQFVWLGSNVAVFFTLVNVASWSKSGPFCSLFWPITSHLERKR